MVRLLLIQILLVQLGALFLSASSTFVEDVSDADYDGVGFYIAVKREAIQNKLDAFHSSVSSKCGDGPKLFIPEVSVLPNLHHSDRHPVYISVGYLTSHDFDDYLEKNTNPCVSVSGLEVSVTIPLLAGSASGQPVYALALARFYEKSRGDIPKINFLYPYIPVDEIQLNDGGALLRNGTDELSISFRRLNDSCKSPTSIVKEEFDKFIFSDFQFGLPSPDFSFCNRHTFESQFCDNYERVKCGVHRYAPNICQMWTSNNHEDCAANVQILNLTSGFRDFILLGNDPINVLASESLHINVQIALKYPCQTN